MIMYICNTAHLNNSFVFDPGLKTNIPDSWSRSCIQDTLMFICVDLVSSLRPQKKPKKRNHHIYVWGCGLGLGTSCLGYFTP